MGILECKFVLEYEDDKKAKIIKDSLDPDNEDYIKLKREGNKLEAFCKAKNPNELLHTVDDFLACLTIAEDSVDRF
ncbi:MAG: KEOPS complex subunit Pcc1 [Thermoplasmata archaeon]